MNARSSTPLLDSLTRAGCHATTRSSKADSWVVPDMDRVPTGLGQVTAIRELSGDHPVQLPPRRGTAGPVPGRVLPGPGPGRRRGRSRGLEAGVDDGCVVDEGLELRPPRASRGRRPGWKTIASMSGA